MGQKSSIAQKLAVQKGWKARLDPVVRFAGFMISSAAFSGIWRAFIGQNRFDKAGTPIANLMNPLALWNFPARKHSCAAMSFQVPLRC